MSDRVFTEEQVAMLIRRATELETERRTQSGKSSGGGLSLSEIESIATDAGIDPQLIREAAREMDRTGALKRQKGKSGVRQKEIFTERTLDYHPSSEALESVVADLDHRYKDEDDSWDFFGWFNSKDKRKNGKVWDLRYEDDWEICETRVLMQPQGKKFRLRISKKLNYGSWGGDFEDMMYFSPFFIVPAILFGILSQVFNWVPPALMIGIVMLIGVLFFVMYPFMRRYNLNKMRQSQEQIEELADEIAEQFNKMAEAGMTTDPAHGTSGKNRTGSSGGQKIHIDDDSPGPEEISGKLRNQLRDR